MALWMLRFSVITEVYNIRMTFTGEKVGCVPGTKFYNVRILGKTICCVPVLLMGLGLQYSVGNTVCCIPS